MVIKSPVVYANPREWSDQFLLLRYSAAHNKIHCVSGTDCEKTMADNRASVTASNAFGVETLKKFKASTKQDALPECTLSIYVCHYKP